MEGIQANLPSTQILVRVKNFNYLVILTAKICAFLTRQTNLDCLVNGIIIFSRDLMSDYHNYKVLLNWSTFVFVMSETGSLSVGLSGTWYVDHAGL